MTEGGVFYPITPSTEMGEAYQLAYAEGKPDVFGNAKVAIEAEGEHAAQGGAIALSVTGKRVVNFTSGQGIVYGLEQYYHAPGKLSTMVLEVGGARADEARAQRALRARRRLRSARHGLDHAVRQGLAAGRGPGADPAPRHRARAQPGINIQDGFLTSHLERTFLKHEAGLIREFLGAPGDVIECPTEAQRTLFGPTRRRVPAMIDLENPMLLGPVQNQEHYMNGVIARRNNFSEPILGFLEHAYEEFAELTGRALRAGHGVLLTDDADVVFVSLGSAAENIEAGVDYLREHDGARVGSVHVNVLRPFPEEAIAKALAGKRNAIVLERTDEPLSGDNPLTREVRAALGKAVEAGRGGDDGGSRGARAGPGAPACFSGALRARVPRLPARRRSSARTSIASSARRGARTGSALADGERTFTLGIEHPYAVVSRRTPSLLPEGAIAVRLHSIGGWGMITTGKNLGEIIGAFGDDIAVREGLDDEAGRTAEVLHISANPKYGSEKKGAPTAYFLVVAPERVRVNCDLHHTNVVLCCDPKAFTHTNPLDGMAPGGTFVWESERGARGRVASGSRARCGRTIIDKEIQLYTLSGFEIAAEATDARGPAGADAGQRVPRGVLPRLRSPRGRTASTTSASARSSGPSTTKKFGRLRRGRRRVEHDRDDAGLRARPSRAPRPRRGRPDTSSLRERRAGGVQLVRRPPGPLRYAREPGRARPRRQHRDVRSTSSAPGSGTTNRRRRSPRWAMMAAATGATAEQVRRAARDAGVDRRELHAVHGVHHGVPRHRAAEHRAGRRLTGARRAARGLRRGLRCSASSCSPSCPAVEERVAGAHARGGEHQGQGRPSRTSCAEEVRGARARRRGGQGAVPRALRADPVRLPKTPPCSARTSARKRARGASSGSWCRTCARAAASASQECGDKDALVMAVETRRDQRRPRVGHELPRPVARHAPEVPRPVRRGAPRGVARGLTLQQPPDDPQPLTRRSSAGDGACAGCGEKSVLHAVASR